MTERFFILTPTPTGRTRPGAPPFQHLGYSIYLDASGKEMLWSADFPIPAVGARVFVTMNGIGWARVEGFFESCGYVGLMIKPTKPPRYYRENTRKAQANPNKPTWMKEGIGCVFGAEVALKRRGVGR